MALTIRELIHERGLSQIKAAKLLRTSQGRVSEVMNGKVSRMTYDRLLGFLNALGSDVQIMVTPPAPDCTPPSQDDPTARGRTRVAT